MYTYIALPNTPNPDCQNNPTTTSTKLSKDNHEKCEDVFERMLAMANAHEQTFFACLSFVEHGARILPTSLVAKVENVLCGGCCLNCFVSDVIVH